MDLLSAHRSRVGWYGLAVLPDVLRPAIRPPARGHVNQRRPVYDSIPAGRELEGIDHHLAYPFRRSRALDRLVFARRRSRLTLTRICPYKFAPGELLNIIGHISDYRKDPTTRRSALGPPPTEGDPQPTNVRHPLTETVEGGP